jgi:hypothetical protein
MAKKIPVGLDLRNAQYGTLPGYKETTALNGAKYYYKYSGGTDGNGNIIVKKNKPVEITVTVGNDARYSVNNVNVTNDTHNDITKSWSGKTATINDSATDVESNIYYEIIVCDSTADTNFGCDPRIDNVPPN